MAAVAAGIRHVQAHDQRLRRALRQREHGLDPRQPRAQDAARARARRRRPLDGLTELSRSRRRDRQPQPERLPAVRRPLGVRPQGRRPRRGRRQGRAELPARRPDRRRQRRPARRLASSAAGRTRRSGPQQLGHELEGVVDPRELSQLIKQLESEGLAFEGAEASFELLIRRHAARLRRAVPDRRLHLPRRAARRPRAARRGDRQGRGRRRGPPHRRRRQRPGQRPRRRAAQGAPRVLSRASTTSTSSTTRCASSTATRPRPPGRG